MARLRPGKLEVTFGQGTDENILVLPRKYTLTHSDFSGQLFLTISRDYNRGQVSGLYTRFMRDEVLAEWKCDSGVLSLHVFCHVSGGLVLGRGNWRESIFRREMPLVLEAIRHGDRKLFEARPDCDSCRITVHYQSSGSDRKIEDWGRPSDHKI
jgi:hypothetical protein